MGEVRRTTTTKTKTTTAEKFLRNGVHHANGIEWGLVRMRTRLNACWNVSVFVTTVMERPQNAHAPTGKGVSTSPVIVLRNIASSVHASGTTAAGHGTRNFTTTPTATEIIAGPSFAPVHLNGSDAAASPAAATTGEEEEDADARVVVVVVVVRARRSDADAV